MEINSVLLCQRLSDSSRAFADGIGESGSIMGTRPGAQPQEVVVTVQGEGVACYSSRTQKRLWSLPLGPGRAQFTAPAVWDALSGKYYTCLRLPAGTTTEVVSWGLDSSTPLSGHLAGLPKRANVAGPVHSLFPLAGPWGPAHKSKSSEGPKSAPPEDPAGGILVLTQNGSIHTYSPGLAQTSSTSQPGDATWRSVEAVAVLRSPDRDPSAAAGQRRIEPPSWRLAVVVAERVQGSEAGGSNASPAERTEAGAGDKRKVQRAVRIYAVGGGDAGGEGAGSGGERKGPTVTLVGSLSLAACEAQGSQGQQRGRVLAASCSEEGDITVLWEDGTWEAHRAVRRGMPAGRKGEMVWTSEKRLWRKLGGFQLTLPADENMSPTPRKSSKKRRTPGEPVGHAGVQHGPAVAMEAIPGSAYVAVVGRRSAKGNAGSLSSVEAVLGGKKQRAEPLTLAVLDTLYGCVHFMQDLSSTEEAGLEDKVGRLGLGVQGAHAEGLSTTWVGQDDGLLLVSTPEGVLQVGMDLPPLALAGVLGSMGPQGGGRVGWPGLATEAATAAARLLAPGETLRLREAPRVSVAEPRLAAEAWERGSGEARGGDGGAGNEEGSREEEGGEDKGEEPKASEEEVATKQDSARRSKGVKMGEEEGGGGREWRRARPRRGRRKKSVPVEKESLADVEVEAEGDENGRGWGLVVRREGLPWAEEEVKSLEEIEAEAIQKIEGLGEADSVEAFLSVVASYRERRKGEGRNWRRKSERRRGKAGGVGEDQAAATGGRDENAGTNVEMEEGQEEDGAGRENGVDGHDMEVDGDKKARGRKLAEPEDGVQENGLVPAANGNAEEGRNHSARNPSTRNPSANEERASGDAYLSLYDIRAAAQLMSPRLTAVAAAKCLHAKFWQPLRAFVEDGHLAVTDCPELIATLVEERQVELLERSLVYLPDLPPSDVAMAIHCILASGGAEEFKGVEERRRREATAALAELRRHLEACAEQKGRLLDQNRVASSGEEDEEAGPDGGLEGTPRLAGGLEAGTEGRSKEVRRAIVAMAAIDGFEPSELCLHALIAIRRDESVMSSAIVDLDAGEVVALVKYLRKWMERHAERLGGIAIPRARWAAFPVPSLAQVAAWTSLLLDCHLARLVLLPECFDDLAKLQECVARHAAVTSMAAPLWGMLSHLKDGAMLPGAAMESELGGEASYTVELLDLS